MQTQDFTFVITIGQDCHMHETKFFSYDNLILNFSIFFILEFYVFFFFFKFMLLAPEIEFWFFPGLELYNYWLESIPSRSFRVSRVQYWENNMKLRRVYQLPISNHKRRIYFEIERLKKLALSFYIIKLLIWHEYMTHYLCKWRECIFILLLEYWIITPFIFSYFGLKGEG